MSTAKFDTLSDLAGTYTVPVATVAQGSAKAWVNFNGSGTVAIRAAFNVSSITDNGGGDYTFNFTNALPDVNYAVVSSGGDASTSTAPAIPAAFVLATDTCRIKYVNDGGSVVDRAQVSVAIFR